MPFVERDSGTIIGLYNRPQPGRAEEFLANDDPEVVAYQNPPPPTKRQEAIALLQNKAFQGFVFWLNDPNMLTQFQIGQNYSNQELLDGIESHIP